MPHCASPSVKGSETHRRRQGSGHKPTPSRFVRWVRPSRHHVAQRCNLQTWSLQRVSYLRTALRTRAGQTCSLAVLTQPPRDFFSAISVPDDGNEQARSLCSPSLVSLSFSPVISVDGTAAIPYTKGRREQTWTGPDWPTCQAMEPKPWPPASLLRTPGRYINIVPKELGEGGYHLRIGSAVEPSPPLCMPYWYQEMGKLSRGCLLSTSQICQRHPPTTLCYHTSLPSFQSIPLTLCNTNETNVGTIQAAVVPSLSYLILILINSLAPPSLFKSNLSVRHTCRSTVSAPQIQYHKALS